MVIRLIVVVRAAAAVPASSSVARVQKTGCTEMKPASATPSRKRSAQNTRLSQANSIAADTKPQVTMMRHIQARAPTRRMMRLLGTSKSA